MKKVIVVGCKCGQKLFKYQKVGTGRLIKCYLPRILVDYTDMPYKIKTGAKVNCLACKERVGAIYMIKGVPAVKLNQGQIRPIRLG